MGSGQPTDHKLGIMLVLGSAVIFSLAGTFTKMITADSWVIACWRGLFGWLAVIIYLRIREGTGLQKGLMGLGWRGWCLATVGSLSSLAFISAFKLTYVANVAIIYAAAPFVAAMLEWVFLRTVMRRPLILATLCSMVGIIVMVLGDFKGTHLVGDGLAMLMTIGMALFMVLIRLFRETPVIAAGGFSGLQLFILGWVITDPLSVSRQDLILLILFGLVFAAAFILLTEGTKRITAAESALLGSAETPFAILFAGILLAELPPSQTFLGGTIVMAAVIGYAARDWRQEAMGS